MTAEPAVGSVFAEQARGTDLIETRSYSTKDYRLKLRPDHIAPKMYQFFFYLLVYKSHLFHLVPQLSGEVQVEADGLQDPRALHLHRHGLPV